MLLKGIERVYQMNFIERQSNHWATMEIIICYWTKQRDAKHRGGNKATPCFEITVKND